MEVELCFKTDGNGSREGETGEGGMRERKDPVKRLFLQFLNSQNPDSVTGR